MNGKQEWIELIKSTGPAMGGLMLVAWGGYGFTVVKGAPAPFEYYACLVCLTLMVAGAAIAIYKTATTAMDAKPPPVPDTPPPPTRPDTLAPAPVKKRGPR